VAVDVEGEKGRYLLLKHQGGDVIGEDDVGGIV
jgi:hypothetical protein